MSRKSTRRAIPPNIKKNKTKTEAPAQSAKKTKGAKPPERPKEVDLAWSDLMQKIKHACRKTNAFTGEERDEVMSSCVVITTWLNTGAIPFSGQIPVKTKSDDSDE